MELKKHFPILFLFALIFGCEPKKKDLYSTEYDRLRIKGDTFFAQEKYNQAFYYYYKANESCYEFEKDRKLYALSMMAEIQNTQADFTGVEETVTDALKIKEKSAYSPTLYNLLAMAYQEKKDYENALKYYQLNLKAIQKPYDKLMTKNNIAVVYLAKKKYPKAASILEPLLKNDTLVKHPKQYAKIMDNLGYAYFKLNNPEASSYLNRALQIRDSLKEDYERTASLIHLSEFHLNKNNRLSNDYALKAYQAATRVNRPDDRLEALDFLIKNATDNTFKPYYLIHSSLNDSITNIRQNAKNQFAKIKFDSEKATQALELQKTKSYLYLVLLVLISGLASFIIVAIRKRNRKKIKTISYETETRIAKKIHDELANDVFNVLTYAESQNLGDPNKKETLLDNLDTIYNRTRNISRENSEIQTDSQFALQLTNLIVQYENTTVNVIINKITSINWDEIKKETKIALYRVIQELMVNMKKHSNCSVVILRFENQKSHIEVHYSDNGKGVEMLKSKKGLQNAENRIHAVKGTITFDIESDKGFKVAIVIPK